MIHFASPTPPFTVCTRFRLVLETQHTTAKVRHHTNQIEVLTTKANHPHSLLQTSTGKGVERSSLGGLREQLGQAVQTDIK